MFTENENKEIKIFYDYISQYFRKNETYNLILTLCFLSFFKKCELHENDFYLSEIEDPIFQGLNIPYLLKNLKQQNLLESLLEKFNAIQVHVFEKIDEFMDIILSYTWDNNEKSAQFYTPFDVRELMWSMLFFYEKWEQRKTIYDPACGTGSLIFNKKFNKLIPIGQEINIYSCYLAYLKNIFYCGDHTNICCGNTLTNDYFKTNKFDYIISNPPFGLDWKHDRKIVEQEGSKGFAGRFGAGLPPVGDGQMLFLQTAISKMKDSGSRIAIVHNGSPLFTGDAGSGPSNIRKYILEQDLLEAIIALPTDLFYNTSISTYIWILSNKKEKERKGKVQLINAVELYEKRRKSLGSKRKDIPKKYRDEIISIYVDFKESEISKIFRNEDFGYSKIVIEKPLLDKNKKPIYKKENIQPDPSLRDTENVPLTEDIQIYFEKEVLPFVPDAWIDHSKTKIGYEIPFTRYFYKYIPPRPSKEIFSEIIDLESLITKNMENIANV